MTSHALETIRHRPPTFDATCAARAARAAIITTLTLACGGAPGGGPTTTTCSPTNCAGCCDPAGICQPGSDRSACGTGGLACAACPSGEGCTAGQCGGGCTPSCEGRACGSDGCGGSCGTCRGGTTCNPNGQCASNCEGQICGTTCCSAGQTCDPSTGQCVSSCTPACSCRQCGSDGCGGSCSACPGDASCNASGQCVASGGPPGSCGNPGTGACTDATDLYCGSGCCSPGYPFACASTNLCYTTADEAAAACGSSCTACVPSGGGTGPCAGCLDSTGTCQPGSDPSACGTGGGACSACTPGLRCNAGSCGPAPFPQVPANSGKVLNPMQLVTIVALNDEYASQLFAFGDELIAGAWWAAVSADYRLGTPVSNLHLTGPAIAGSIDLASMESYITQVIASGPQPNGNTLYLLYLPDGVQVTDAPGACGAHSPYPDSATTLGDGWAWVERGNPDCPTPVESTIQYLTRVASHEILEGATDPTTRSYTLDPNGPPAQPWTATVWDEMEPGPIEVGDLCNYTRITESDGYQYQRIYSNSAAAAGGDPCLPQGAAPYFNVSTSYDWYTIPAGSSGSIPIVGWTTGTRGPWLLYGYVVGGDSAFAVSLATSLGTINLEAGCPTAPGMNAATAGSIQVTSPSTAASGDWAVIAILSMDGDFSSCPPPITEDAYHQWYVGVNVP
jgi:hypothetical protein